MSMRVSSSFLLFLPCDCGGGERVAPGCILDRYASCRLWDRPQKQLTRTRMKTRTKRTRMRMRRTTKPWPWLL